MSIRRFRLSRNPSETDTEAPAQTTKARRFSFFRNSARRSAKVIDADLFVIAKPVSPAAPVVEDGSEEEEGEVVDVTEERVRALDILEGRARQESRSSSDGSSSSGTRESSTPPAAPAVPPPVRRAFSVQVPRSFGSVRRLSGGARGRYSLDGARPQVASSPLGLVPESTPSSPIAGSEVADEQGLPTYASATYPSRAVTYRFSQAGPYSMVLMAEDDFDEIPGLGMYHVSVGVSVFQPQTLVTTLRSGLGEDGQMVAQIETGSTSACILMQDVCRQVKDVLSRNINGQRTYNLGNGTSIRWRYSNGIWQATFETEPVATFTTSLPRRLTVQPRAHRWIDHLVVGVILLMREMAKADGKVVHSEYVLPIIGPRAA